MRILLIGEYSNVHYTLAKTLRKSGHEVLLVSDGDGWKNYPRDIDVSRRHRGIIGSICLRLKWLWYLRKLKGYDVVHLINPHFTDMAPSYDKKITDYLAHHNRHLTLGLYGDDYVVMKGQGDGILEYSDTWAYGKEINTETEKARIHAWTVSCKNVCNECTAKAEALIAGLYEYYYLYDKSLDNVSRKKLHYINFPIDIDESDMLASKENKSTDDKRIKILISINKKRAKQKGTDQIIALFSRLGSEHPDKVSLLKAENVPFAEYQKMIASADVIADQMYSYTPAMNALEGMAQGKVVVSGGEEEFYDFIGENDLRPIINLRPFHDEENYRILEETILNKSLIEKMKLEARQFINKYHDSQKIAQQYIDLWNRLNYPS